MFLLFLIGTALFFGNVMNPDLQSDTVRGSFEYYDFDSGNPEYYSNTDNRAEINSDEEDIALFSPGFVTGYGVSLSTWHRVYPSWRHTLNLRDYASDDFKVTFYTTGIDAVTTLPNAPLRLSAGFELGTAMMEIDRLHPYGSVQTAQGGELHAEISYYFVFGERLLNYFLRPVYRSYLFHFDGKPGIHDQTINGEGSGFSAGLGFRFK